MLTHSKVGWHVVNQEGIQRWVHDIDGIPDYNHVHLLRELYRPASWSVRYTRAYFANTVYRHQHFRSAETVAEINGFENGEFQDGPEDLRSETQKPAASEGVGSCLFPSTMLNRASPC